MIMTRYLQRSSLLLVALVAHVATSKRLKGGGGFLDDAADMMTVESLTRALQEVVVQQSNLTADGNKTINTTSTTRTYDAPSGITFLDRGTSVNDTGATLDVDLGDILGIGCFSERGVVQVQGQDEPVLMMNLRVGDKVLTADQTYAPVYVFGHRNVKKPAVFVQLQTPHSNNPLELTAEHLVYLHGKSKPVRADSVMVGDVLQGQYAGVKVTSIERVVRRGVYAPFTTKGTIVVDGIASSSYVSLQDGNDNLQLHNGFSLLSQHDFVHMSMAPLRLACLHISGSFCKHDNLQGMPRYVSSALEFQRDTDKQCILVQFLALVGVIVVMSFFHAEEFLLDFVQDHFLVIVSGAVIATIVLAYDVRVRVRVKLPQQGGRQ